MPVISSETEEKLMPFKTTVKDLVVSFVPVIPTIKLWQKQFPSGYLPGRNYSDEASLDKTLSLPIEASKIFAAVSTLLLLAMCYEGNRSPIPVILPTLLLYSLTSFGIFGVTKEFNANARQQIMHLADHQASQWVQE